MQFIFDQLEGEINNRSEDFLDAIHDYVEDEFFIQTYFENKKVSLKQIYEAYGEPYAGYT